MKIRVTVCIGSSCHLKGSRQVVESIREMIAANNLEDFEGKVRTTDSWLTKLFGKEVEIKKLEIVEK